MPPFSSYEERREQPLCRPAEGFCSRFHARNEAMRLGAEQGTDRQKRTSGIQIVSHPATLPGAREGWRGL